MRKCHKCKNKRVCKCITCKKACKCDGIVEWCYRYEKGKKNYGFY